VGSTLDSGVWKLYLRLCENNSKTSGTNIDSKITVLSCPMQLTIASLTS
jgi:hypothetical protein